MSLYDKLAGRFAIAPIATKVPSPADGVDFDLRHNYATLANGVELVTEVIMDIAKRTDAISLDMAGSRLRRNDVTASVARSLETRINSHLPKGEEQ